MKKNKNLLLILVVFLISVIMVFISRIKYNTTFFGDALGYYSYFYLVYIKHNVNDIVVQYHMAAFGISQIGRTINHYSIGTSILMTPFYYIASLFNLIFEGAVTDGYTLINQIFLYFSTIFYMLLGLILNYQTLILKFDKKIALKTLAAIFFGTGILAYSSTFPAYSHIYSYFIISLFIFMLFQEKYFITSKRKQILYSIIIGFLIGMATLIRTYNIMLILIYFLKDFNSRERLKRIFKPINLVSLSSMIFILYFPQMLYYKFQTGNFLVNPYKYNCIYNMIYHIPNYENQFDFSKNYILQVLFSLKKGLFIFYPVLLFSVFGLFKIKNYLPKYKVNLLTFLIITSYIISSWRCWWYGYSFGQRVYVDYMAIFAILIAVALAEIEKIKNKNLYTILQILFYLTIIIAFILYILFLFRFFDKDGGITLF